MAQFLNLMRKPRTNTLSPNQLSNLLLWLKSDAGVTEAGGTISHWADSSLAGHDVAQANSGQRPALQASQLAGKPAVYFDVNGSSRDSLILSASDRFQNLWREGGYVAMVFENRGTPQGASGFGVLLSSSAWFLSIADYSAVNHTAKLALHQYCSGNDNQWRTSSAVLSDNTPYLVEFIFNGFAINRKPKIFVNGVLQALTQSVTASGSPDNDFGNTIGLMGWYTNDQNNNTEGALYEMVATRTIPNLHERNALRRYFASRWGIAVAEESCTPVYIMGGQSNMVGLGTISAAPSAYISTQSNVKIWNGSSFANLTAGTNNEGASSGEFGPELSFGYHAAAGLQKTIYLVKYAASGKSLAVDFAAPGGTNCTALKTKVDNALANLISAGHNPIIMGFCWAQGESDADSSDEAAAYERNLATFIAYMRICFAEYMDHDAPFLISGIAAIDPVLFPYADTVRAAQNWIGGHRIGARYFPTADLSLLNDDVHFDTAAQITLGQRFAEALLSYSYPNHAVFDLRHNNALRLWLDAADEACWSKDGNQKVSRAWDKSGSGFCLKNSGNASTQGTYTDAGIVFDGTDDYLQESSFAPGLLSITHFYAMRLLSNGNYDIYWSYQNINSTSSEMRSSGTTGEPGLVVEASAIGTFSESCVGEDILVVTRIDGLLNQAHAWVNGAETISGSYSGDIPASDVYTIAARSTPSDYGNIRLYENLIYNEAMTNAQINEVASHLAAKWGLSWQPI